MNREIKFRGKTPQGEWGYGYLIKTSGNGTQIGREIEEGKMRFSVVRGDTIGQFTGLKDKNGKEIYEDDIVRFAADGPTSITARWCTEVVEWMPGRCAFFPLHFKSEYYYLDENGCLQGMEVIGNIHDNSELIGGER